MTLVRRLLLLAGISLLAVAPAYPAQAATAAAPSGSALTVVGSDPLGSRGMNAALAVAGHCAYVGSRNDAAPQVVDIADPTHPRVVGALPSHPGSTPRELRAVESQRLVVVLFYRLNGGINGLDILRWDSDCATPAPLGRYDFGGAAPHEFYLWQDPASPARILLFVTMFGASPGLQVINISNPASPARVGTWTVPGGYGHAPVHSISISADARTAYLSLWTGGLLVADVSDFTSGKPQPALRPYTPPGSVFATPPGNVHSAVPLVGRSMVMTTDERYPAPSGAGCPFGTAHIVDVSDPAHPLARATIAVPENTPATCAAATRGTYTSHNVTMTPHLAFITWYSGGVEVVGLDDPTQPVRLAEFRPAGVSPAVRDPQLGVTDAMSWSYPVISHGLVYVADINQGLLVLRYTGAHQDEVSSLGFAEGNSNLTAVLAPSPSSPVASPAATASPRARAASPKKDPPSNNQVWQVFLAAALGAVGARGVIALIQRRRRAGATHSNL